MMDSFEGCRLMNVTNNNLPWVASFAVTAAAFEGGLALFAVGLGWALDLPPMETFRWSWPDLGWGIVATLPPLTLLGLCLYLPWEPLRKILRLLNETVLPLFRQCGLMEIAVIALLAGLGEEMLFRPIVQEGLSRWIGLPYGPACGLIAAAVFFGLLHGMTLAYAILAAVIGLYLGIVWKLNGNLMIPIVTHALYDFIALAVLIRRQPPIIVEKDEVGSMKDE
jgi:uncharacterized protein